MQNVDKHQVKAFLMALQDSICAELAAADGAASFAEESWDRPKVVVAVVVS